MPDELAYAIRINVSELAPSEYWAMESDDLYLVTSLRAAWEAGKKEARKQIANETEQ